MRATVPNSIVPISAAWAAGMRRAPAMNTNKASVKFVKPNKNCWVGLVRGVADAARANARSSGCVGVFGFSLGG